MVSAAIQNGGLGFCVGRGSDVAFSKLWKRPLRRDFFLLEQAAHLLESLLETRPALVHRNAEAGKLVRQESAGKAHLQPAGGNRIDHPDLARKLQRVVEHRQHRAGDQTHERVSAAAAERKMSGSGL